MVPLCLVLLFCPEDEVQKKENFLYPLLPFYLLRLLNPRNQDEVISPQYAMTATEDQKGTAVCVGVLSGELSELLGAKNLHRTDTGAISF